MLTISACGSEGDETTNEGVSSGGEDGGGSSNTQTGTNGDANGPTLFTGTPTCPSAGGTSLLKVEGDLDGHSIKYEQSGVSTYLQGSMFSTVQFEGNVEKDYINIQHDSATLQPGEVHNLIGQWLDFPDSISGGSGPYCIVGGEIGSVPVAQKPATGAEIRFRVTKVRKRSKAERTADGVCEGSEISVDVRGCVYRDSDYLP